MCGWREAPSVPRCRRGMSYAESPLPLYALSLQAAHTKPLPPPSLTAQLLPGESLFGAMAVYVAAVAAGHATSALQLNLPPLVGMLLAGTYMRTLSTLSTPSPNPPHPRPLTPRELALQPPGVPNAISPLPLHRDGGC